jgi:hypothetical protein
VITDFKRVLIANRGEAVTSLFTEAVRPRLRDLTGRVGDPGLER